jgi:uncharacterized protein
MSKLERLQKLLNEMNGVLVAFSGGVDSSFLLKVAHDTLGERAVAVTAVSETYPEHELASAKKVAVLVGAKHVIIETSEFEVAEFRNNAPDRCYYCKKELFGKLKELAVELGLAVVVDGANADDTSDFRPGMRACRELGVCSPLQEAGFTKEEIRALSKEMDLPTWDMPSYACLASRFPYGTEITPEGLLRVGKGEEFLHSLGLRQVRLRDHGSIARIEVPLEAFDLVLQHKDEIVKSFKELGYLYVALDLEGYRMGSMNEGLERAIDN